MVAITSADAILEEKENAMTNTDVERIALGLFLSLPDDEREAIVTRACENSIAKDGSGIDLMPRESKEALLREAYREIESDKEAAKRPPKFSTAELAVLDLEKAAFGKRISLASQGALVKHFQDSGMSPKEAAAKAAERAAAWGTKLGSLARGRNPHKNAETADGGEPNKSANGSDKRPEKKSGGDSKNPWKNSGPEAEAARINIIRQLGTAAAAGMAKAAGKSIGGQPLKRAG